MGTPKQEQEAVNEILIFMSLFMVFIAGVGVTAGAVLYPFFTR